ncbi:hypothetical protein [Streptomyces qinglanensis]|uniref:Uncharacterized protein n=1 Tax=Streptomyces qinglanensis TaxID=943816 RepID=A0A1H9U3G3_9ACTN|nr:hypothetical protein [Streptomyces qinglanensis]SES03704.1 hypothetical protein SAMN05421870_107263 [Streptomyces qinglanensis]
MPKYKLTMEIDAPDEYGPTGQGIRDAVYDACEDVPFAFEITEIKES